ncbi:MAG TPA: VOC family protein [Polyangia bacterium]
MAGKIPEGYHTVTPYIVATDGDRVLDFIKQAFDGEVLERMDTPGGMHSEIRIGDSRVMVGGKKDGSGAMPAMFYVYVADADETYRRMLAAGGSSLEAPNDAPYGDRRAGAKDPCGNQWYVAHRR